MKNVAIVLAGGRGSRMNTTVSKQYLEIGGKPILYYSLLAFQKNSLIDEIVLVCGAEDIDNCRQQFVDGFGLNKIKHIVAGGKERSDSVYAGLEVITECKYVFIHDGVRPFLDEGIFNRLFEALETNQACIAAMPVKDTIKMADDDDFVESTPPRNKLWLIQTPQAFDFEMIKGAYDKMKKEYTDTKIFTDDAMIAENIAGACVKLVEGSYNNIKITTPEDLVFAEAILKM